MKSREDFKRHGDRVEKGEEEEGRSRGRKDERNNGKGRVRGGRGVRGGSPAVPGSATQGRDGTGSSGGWGCHGAGSSRKESLILLGFLGGPVCRAWPV